jgi:hypothetical protein
MTCRHCHEQHIQRCPNDSCWFFDCRGWVHSEGSHSCQQLDESAEPEPSQPEATS